MNPSPAPTARVSRHELALNQYVWLATGITFGGIAFATLLIAFLPLGLNRLHLLAFTGVLAAESAWVLLTQPAPIGSIRNHVQIAAIYVCIGLGMLAYAPDSVTPLGATIFIAPVTVMRLVDRREISAHLIAATACLIAPSVYAGAHFGGVLGLVSLLVAMWTLAAMVGLVLEASEAQGTELEDLVRRDPLTGLGNRRILTEHLASEMRRHARARRPLTVLAIDLNGFKAINDIHGHAAGDELLQAVAASLVATLGPQDLVVRQGGDEFCVVLPDTSPEQAPRAVNAVRAALAACGDGVSAGIGVASFPRDAVHDKVLLHVADERLLESKAAGRAAIAVAPDPGPGDRAGLTLLPIDDRLSA